MPNTITVSKSISIDRWGEFFDQFSDGNRGRHVSIEVILAGLVNEVLIKKAPLMAIIYDPPTKGDNVTIEVGKNEVDYAHTVNSPVEVLTGQDSNGKMVSISIKDADARITIIEFKDI
jgi:hypothetical protein